MTPKQQEFVERLPQNGYNMAKTMREVGYTEQSSKAGTLYKSLRKLTKYEKGEEDIRLDFLKVLDRDIKRFKKKDKDNPCYCRMVELKSKILALQVEKKKIDADFNINKEEQGIINRYFPVIANTN